MEVFKWTIMAILSVTGLVISAGVPLFIFQFKLLRDDVKELKRSLEMITTQLHSHCTDYEIHRIDK